jgi:acetyltransferase-like isoleucine patch superfamily enzyme
MTAVRWILAVAVAALPSAVKVPIYRWAYGYRIGRGVRIGFSPFVGVARCTIGDHARIGSFNLFTRVKDLAVGPHARIGVLNLFRGGDRVTVGEYATILRLNVFNAIVDGDFVAPVVSVLELGAGVFVATGHWLDFSDGIRVGAHSIIGGRHSSFWTHNRQRGRSIAVGRHAYLGSEVRVAPGAEIPAFSVVALGSVVTGRLGPERVLIGGNPARVVRELANDDLFLVTRKTRNDIPDEVAYGHLPDDCRRTVEPILGTDSKPVVARPDADCP